ncbi:MAG: hypothetical protein KAG66_21745 [Methylococcales bacterium]|nr:hypothetical protein [Methylococcales bacterium]
MTGTAAGIIFSFLIATAYGSGFHLFMGGPARRIALYLFSAWIGFTIGHFLGDLFNITLLKLGVIHLFSASFGAWIALIVAWFLVRNE